MTPYKPANSITCPDCPRCGTRMMLARITLVRDKPDYDKRYFECANCGNEISEAVLDP